MLFRKTFRNALATLLGMALALATGSAHAQRVDLDGLGTVARPFNTAVYSLETLKDTTSMTVNVGTTKYYVVDNNSDRDIEAYHTIGAQNVNNRVLYLRYKFTNMVFAEAMFQGAVTAVPTNNQVGFEVGTTAGAAEFGYEAGGGVGQDYLVVRVTGNTGTNAWTPTSPIRARWQKLAILPNATGTISYSVHVTLESGLSGANELLKKPASGGAPAVGAQRSVGTLVAPGVITASVASGFRQFGGTTPNSPQNLGSIAISVGPAQGTHLVADGGGDVSGLADVMDTSIGKSTILIEGDFRVGRFTSTRAGGATTCGAGSSVLATKDATTMEVRPRVTIPAAMGTTLFCVTVASNNQDTIPSGVYMVSTNYSPITNAAFPPMEQAETMLGRIRYDGTRVHLPYLTTATSQVHRVVIVNRNPTSVRYEFSFIEESDTTATRSDMARGSVPAMTTMVLRATDIVSLSGKTRTAATLDIVAASGTVDVMTTLVNREDGSTDTVRYENVDS